jgi:hypothetical protein
MKTLLSITFIFIFSFAAFAQNQEKQTAYKFFEFGKISGKLLNEKTTEFCDKLRNDPNLQGYIINYGTDKEIAKREKRFQERVTVPETRIIYARSRNQKQLSELWIVPAGAKMPTPISEK